jgi:hypothetical protein
LEELSDLKPAVRPERILRAHYPAHAPVAPEVRATAEAMAAHALELASPVAWLRQAPADALAVTSATLANSLRGCFAAQLFLVTLGSRLDQRVSELFEAMDGLEGLFLDTAGWLALQSALGALRRRLGARARAGGYRLTRRVGPGYLDWPIEEQPLLVGALAEGKSLPGIEVLESGAILPEKTITGLFGLTKE